MIKKVVIAAAGRGVRMGDLTNTRPKPLIPVCTKPFLYYLINDFKTAGYSEFVIIAGYQAAQMKAFTAQYFPEALIVDQFEILGQKKYGTACTIECLQKIMPDESFVYVYGDNLYSPADLKRMNKNDDFHYVAGYYHKHPEKYGVLKTHGDFLESIVEKPKEFLGNTINTGLYKFTPEIFDVIPQLKPSVRGEYELTDAVSILAARNKVKVITLQDYWMDFGKPEDIPVIENFLCNRPTPKST